jgi:hypothetical protein
MTKSYPVTEQSRAASLTAVMRREPPKLRLSKGMADAARAMETESDKRSQGGARPVSRGASPTTAK